MGVNTRSPSASTGRLFFLGETWRAEYISDILSSPDVGGLVSPGVESRTDHENVRGNVIGLLINRNLLLPKSLDYHKFEAGRKAANN